jgi:NAD(P)-dependent dehydrogenase (short-subunit alcohol dehydrogenase family)
MSADGLSGRIAVVTGALGNLGPVWTAALADAGARVVGVDVRAGDGVLQADVTDRAALERVLADVGAPSTLRPISPTTMLTRASSRGRWR